MAWVKGQSGNPAGRPRTDKALKAYLEQKYGQDGKALVDALDTLSKGAREDIQFQALKLLLAYVAGTPVQRAEVGGDGAKPLVIQLTDAAPPDTEHGLSE